ncbi:hypothetical protein M23134_01617 [Microscilla marina ATCC 23134]|uniref:Uncharacterized protein n=1 Tax=Microscilla marina ATCC 23134 TaxID=313606 RepID=A1ZTN5_MICM2|nr:hypothetical protein M23134_01617 [Microscilla marina ATCC 23134]
MWVIILQKLQLNLFMLVQRKGRSLAKKKRKALPYAKGSKGDHLFLF